MTASRTASFIAGTVFVFAVVCLVAHGQAPNTISDCAYKRAMEWMHDSSRERSIIAALIAQSKILQICVGKFGDASSEDINKAFDGMNRAMQDVEKELEMMGEKS